MTKVPINRQCNEMDLDQVPSLWRNKPVQFERSEPEELFKIHLIAQYTQLLPLNWERPFTGHCIMSMFTRQVGCWQCDSDKAYLLSSFSIGKAAIFILVTSSCQWLCVLLLNSYRMNHLMSGTTFFYWQSLYQCKLIRHSWH